MKKNDPPPDEQLDLIPASEASDDVALLHGKPYRPGTSFGYFHAPVKIFDSDLTQKAIFLFLRMLSDESLGQETPDEFFNLGDCVVSELTNRRMIEPDGADWKIFEPEFWKL